MTVITPDYTHLDHTADLGIMVRENDLSDLFEHAGMALMHLMLKVKSSKRSGVMKISVSGDDLEDLMVRWLGEILYLFEGENLVVAAITIDSLSGLELEATLKTADFDPRIHEPIREVKGVTYHQIEVAEKGGIWEARVIFDL